MIVERMTKGKWVVIRSNLRFKDEFEALNHYDHLTQQGTPVRVFNPHTRTKLDNWIAHDLRAWYRGN